MFRRRVIGLLFVAVWATSANVGAAVAFGNPANETEFGAENGDQVTWRDAHHFLDKNELSLFEKLSSIQVQAINDNIFIILGNLMTSNNLDQIQLSYINNYSNINDSSGIHLVKNTGDITPRDNYSLLFHMGKIYIIGGKRDNTILSDIIVSNYMGASVDRSLEKIDWLSLSSENFPPRADHASFSHHGRMFVTGGLDESNRETDEILASVDGVDWESVESDARFLPRAGHRIARSDDRVFMAGGYRVPSEGTIPVVLDDLWWSRDGRRWEKSPTRLPSPPRVGFSLTWAVDKLWLIGGRAGNVALSDVWSSLDGVIWTRVDRPGDFPKGVVDPVVWTMQDNLHMINRNDPEIGAEMRAQNKNNKDYFGTSFITNYQYGHIDREYTNKYCDYLYNKYAIPIKNKYERNELYSSMPKKYCEFLYNLFYTRSKSQLVYINRFVGSISVPWPRINNLKCARVTCLDENGKFNTLIVWYIFKNESEISVLTPELYFQTINKNIFGQFEEIDQENGLKSVISDLYTKYTNQTNDEVKVSIYPGLDNYFQIYVDQTLYLASEFDIHNGSTEILSYHMSCFESPSMCNFVKTRFDNACLKICQGALRRDVVQELIDIEPILFRYDERFLTKLKFKEELDWLIVQAEEDSKLSEAKEDSTSKEMVDTYINKLSEVRGICTCSESCDKINLNEYLMKNDSYAALIRMNNIPINKLISALENRRSTRMLIYYSSENRFKLLKIQDIVMECIGTILKQNLYDEKDKTQFISELDESSQFIVGVKRKISYVMQRSSGK